MAARLWPLLSLPLGPPSAARCCGGGRLPGMPQQERRAGIERPGLSRSAGDYYQARLACRKIDPLYPANRMCFLLKRFLGAHPGFDRDDLQGHLNLFHVIANPPEDKMEKAAMVLDRAMQCPKTVRFRSFYNVKSR